ncbi:phage tail protein [Escherichia coli]|nr:phage tail protein [Escherichia coli]
MDNGAHFDGDQSGTVNGVTPPAVQHLTAEVTADSGEYQVLARWDTPKVVKGVSFLPVSYTHLDVYKRQQLLSVIDAISEGPVEGPVDGLKSVLLNLSLIHI